MSHASEPAASQQALKTYEELISRYRAILSGADRDDGGAEAIVEKIAGMLDGPDWRAAAELRHDALGLALTDGDAFSIAMHRLSR